MGAERWRIAADAADWECTWAADELFHMRYFRALSLAEKIGAVEQMEEVAASLHGGRPRTEEADGGRGRSRRGERGK